MRGFRMPGFGQLFSLYLKNHPGNHVFKYRLVLMVFVISIGNERQMKIAAFVRLSLLSVLVLTQTPSAYSIELSAPATSNVSNCISNSHFEADLQRLSDTIKQHQDIPRAFLERHFAGCTIENGRELLVKNGFGAEELGPEFDESEPGKVIPRDILTAKTIRFIGLYGSLNCRIILQTDTLNRISARVFFYFDGP